MANDATKARVAVTGSLYIDITAAGAAPTSQASALAAAYKDMGYVSEDGVTLTMPDAGDSTPLKVWQNDATVRTVRSLTEDSPQITCTLVETKLEVIQAVFGTTVTQTGTEGSFEIDTTDTRTHVRAVLDVVDGAELIRVYAPYALVTSVGEIALTSRDLIGYQITLDLERDTTAGYNFKTWMTELAS